MADEMKINIYNQVPYLYHITLNFSFVRSGLTGGPKTSPDIIATDVTKAKSRVMWTKHYKVM